MIREISMFSATADLEVALTTLSATALGLGRNVHRLPLARIRELLTGRDGHDALHALARRFSIEGVPDRPTIDRLFDDELLSMRALAQHRGRNVYSSGKLALWNALWLPFRDRLVPDARALSLLGDLISLRTFRDSPDIEPTCTLLEDRLAASGFAIERVDGDGHAPILIARRDAREMRGRVVLYGHYDAAETSDSEWEGNPWALTERDGRLLGCAIGDNKAPLAVRIAAIESMERSPELIWIIQGEEEIGSPLAHARMPEILRGLTATIWLEENGYHELDGTQRVLARTIGPGGTSAEPDGALRSVLDALAIEAASWGVRSRLEIRGLNKDFFAGGCPFNRNLPLGARYLAIGVNDPASGIHRPNESVPMWTFALHARQLRTLFEVVDLIGRGDA